MIPYPELVAALERWRMRNGLPVGGGGVMPAASYTAAPMTTPMTAPPRPAPVAAKIPTRPQTDEPLDLGDADVLDEDMLSSEGGDFAMAFGVSTSAPAPLPAAHAYDEDEAPDEKTAIGNPGEPLSPFGPPGADTFDADDEVLAEEEDPDPRRRP